MHISLATRSHSQSLRRLRCCLERGTAVVIRTRKSSAPCVLRLGQLMCRSLSLCVVSTALLSTVQKAQIKSYQPKACLVARQVDSAALLSTEKSFAQCS